MNHECSSKFAYIEEENVRKSKPIEVITIFSDEDENSHFEIEESKVQKKEITTEDETADDLFEASKIFTDFQDLYSTEESVQFTPITSALQINQKPIYYNRCQNVKSTTVHEKPKFTIKEECISDERVTNTDTFELCEKTQIAALNFNMNLEKASIHCVKQEKLDRISEPNFQVLKTNSKLVSKLFESIDKDAERTLLVKIKEEVKDESKESNANKFSCANQPTPQVSVKQVKQSCTKPETACAAVISSPTTCSKNIHNTVPNQIAVPTTSMQNITETDKGFQIKQEVIDSFGSSVNMTNMQTSVRVEQKENNFSSISNEKANITEATEPFILKTIKQEPYDQLSLNRIDDSQKFCLADANLTLNENVCHMKFSVYSNPGAHTRNDILNQRLNQADNMHSDTWKNSVENNAIMIPMTCIKSAQSKFQKLSVGKTEYAKDYTSLHNTSKQMPLFATNEPSPGISETNRGGCKTKQTVDDFASPIASADIFEPNKTNTQMSVEVKQERNNYHASSLSNTKVDLSEATKPIILKSVKQEPPDQYSSCTGDNDGLNCDVGLPNLALNENTLGSVKSLAYPAPPVITGSDVSNQMLNGIEQSDDCKNSVENSAIKIPVSIPEEQPAVSNHVQVKQKQTETVECKNAEQVQNSSYQASLSFLGEKWSQQIIILSNNLIKSDDYVDSIEKESPTSFETFPPSLEELEMYLSLGDYTADSADEMFHIGVVKEHLTKERKNAEALENYIPENLPLPKELFPSAVPVTQTTDRSEDLCISTDHVKPMPKANKDHIDVRIQSKPSELQEGISNHSGKEATQHMLTLERKEDPSNLASCLTVETLRGILSSIPNTSQSMTPSSDVTPPLTTSHSLMPSRNLQAEEGIDSTFIPDIISAPKNLQESDMDIRPVFSFSDPLCSDSDMNSTITVPPSCQRERFKSILKSQDYTSTKTVEVNLDQMPYSEHLQTKKRRSENENLEMNSPKRLHQDNNISPADIPFTLVGSNGSKHQTTEKHKSQPSPKLINSSNNSDSQLQTAKPGDEDMPLYFPTTDTVEGQQSHQKQTLYPEDESHYNKKVYNKEKIHPVSDKFIRNDNLISTAQPSKRKKIQSDIIPLPQRESTLNKEWLHSSLNVPVPIRSQIYRFTGYPVVQRTAANVLYHNTNFQNYVPANINPFPTYTQNYLNNFPSSTTVYPQTPISYCFLPPNWNFLSNHASFQSQSRIHGNAINDSINNELLNHSISFVPPLPTEPFPPLPPLPPTSPPSDKKDLQLDSPSSLTHIEDFHKISHQGSPTSSVVIYEKPQTLPVQSSTHQTSMQHEHLHPVISETATSSECDCTLPPYLTNAVGIKIMSPNEVLVVILSWKVKWFVDHRKDNELPPICTSIQPVSRYYFSYEDYYNTYLPLLLIETWERIHYNWKVIMQQWHPGFLSKIAHWDIVGELMETKCCINVSDSERYPIEGDVVLLKFLYQHENVVFGYISNQEYVNNGSDSKYSTASKDVLCLCIKTIKLKDNSKGQVKIYPLYNIKIPLTQVKALRDIGLSPLYKTILHPCSPVCDKVVLGRIKTTSSKAVSWAVAEILKSAVLDDPSPCITIVDAPFGTDQLTILVSLIEQVKKIGICGLNSRILVCTRSNNRLNEIGVRLISTAEDSEHEVKTVILAKVKDIKSPELEKKTLDYMTDTYLQLKEDQRKTKLPKEYVTFQTKVLQTCDVLLTFITTCHHSSVYDVLGSESESPISFCIVDEAYMCTEPETLVPLLYGIKKIIFFGDPSAKPKLWTKMAKNNGLKQSLIARLLKALHREDLCK